MGSYAREPADISQAEWDQQRGEVLRLSGVVGTLTAKLDQAEREIAAIAKRQTRQSDWRDTTGKHDLDLLEKQIAQYEGKEARRVALWVKIALMVAGVLASAAVGHWLR